MQFLLAGLLLFALHALLNPNAPRLDGSRRIELTEADLRQLTLTWLAQGRQAPTPAQIRSLVEARVREEILYREALVLGLDEGDTIIRRRLAQKMEFLSEDAAAAREPTGAELRAWFAEHPKRFTLPARASFRHLYFSPDPRGARARDDAARALEVLAGTPVDAPPASGVADAFMFQDHYSDRSLDEVSALFGAAFARALSGLQAGSWQGPIESGYGWHLVWLDSITPARVPSFEAVAPDVRTQWLAEQRRMARTRAFETLRARYRVVLPPEIDGEVALAAASR